MFHVSSAEGRPTGLTDDKIVPFNPKEPDLKLPFHVAGNFLIATGGLPEMHPRPASPELNAFISHNREVNRLWRIQQNAGRIAPVIRLR